MGCNPAAAKSNVDLPDPLGPVRATVSPGATLNVTSSTTFSVDPGRSKVTAATSNDPAIALSAVAAGAAAGAAISRDTRLAASAMRPRSLAARRNGATVSAKASAAKKPSAAKAGAISPAWTSEMPIQSVPPATKAPSIWNAAPASRSTRSCCRRIINRRSSAARVTSACVINRPCTARSRRARIRSINRDRNACAAASARRESRAVLRVVCQKISPAPPTYPTKIQAAIGRPTSAQMAIKATACAPSPAIMGRTRRKDTPSSASISAVNRFSACAPRMRIMRG